MPQPLTPKKLKLNSTMVIAAMKLKDAYTWKESYDQPRQHVEKQSHSLVGAQYDTGEEWRNNSRKNVDMTGDGSPML